MQLQKIQPLENDFLESIGFTWHTDEDTSAYVSDSLVQITTEDAEAYYGAANELYDMFVEAGEYVIENDLLHQIGIPFNLTEAVKLSWENDVHWHLYGRYDFAGGIGGEPIKLIEFNADTPTALFETSIIQWALLKANGMDEASQFNNINEAIATNFKRLVMLDGDVEEFAQNYDGWKILFSSVKGNIEEENTTRYLEQIAIEAGFHTAFAYIDEIEFSEDDGIYYEGEQYEFFFKLLPWEDIAVEEGDLAMLLTDIMQNQKAIILNPAYTLMFQSKAMMAILWELFPEHPLLLETSYEPLEGRAYVEKKVFGREGANTAIYDEDGELVTSREGEYENNVSIYQEYVQLSQDEEEKSYQAGVFFAYEGCGLGFRKGELILDNMSKFVGHVIKD